LKSPFVLNAGLNIVLSSTRTRKRHPSATERTAKNTSVFAESSSVRRSEPPTFDGSTIAGSASLERVLGRALPAQFGLIGPTKATIVWKSPGERFSDTITNIRNWRSGRDQTNRRLDARMGSCKWPPRPEDLHWASKWFSAENLRLLLSLRSERTIQSLSQI